MQEKLEDPGVGQGPAVLTDQGAQAQVGFLFPMLRETQTFFLAVPHR